MLELSTAVFGFGNMGGQTASIAARDFKIPSVAVNSSVKDLDMVTDATTILIGDGRGTGKSRQLAREFIEGNIEGFLSATGPDGSDINIPQLIEQTDVIFLVSSTGGGMGSGSVPPMLALLSSIYPHKMFVGVLCLPSLSESLAAQQHTVEALLELETMCANVTYMLYDNSKYTGMHQAEIFRRVNEDIVRDICVLTGRHNLATNLSSIDENDMLRLINNPGRLVVGRLENIQQRDINKTSLTKSLRNAISNSGQADLEENPELVQGIGVICNLDNKFDDYVISITEDIQDEFGECVEDYSHLRVNSDQSENEAYVILSGWDVPSKRIETIKTRQSELQTLLEKRNSKSIISGVDTLSTACSRNVTQRSIGNSNVKNKVDVAAIMAGFKNVSGK